MEGIDSLDRDLRETDDHFGTKYQTDDSKVSLVVKDRLKELSRNYKHRTSFSKEVTEAERKEAYEYFSNADLMIRDSIGKMLEAVTSIPNVVESADSIKSSIETFIDAAKERNKGNDILYDNEMLNALRDKYLETHEAGQDRKHNNTQEGQAAYGERDWTPEQYANDRK